MKANERLKKHIKKEHPREDGDVGAFAVKNDIPYTTVVAWLNGSRRPSLESAMELESITGIKAKDWLK